MKVFAGIQDSREAWTSERAQYGAYLSSPEWRAKRDRAFIIWRGLGWFLTAGPLVLRLWFPVALTGAATLLLAWPAQVLAAFGLAYAATIRGTALAQNRRLRREGNHLFGYGSLNHERWWDIIPGTRGVNWGEHFLRRFLPGPKAHRYFLRTVIAALVMRFWWVAVALGAAVYLWGWHATYAWLQMAGRMI